MPKKLPAKSELAVHETTQKLITIRVVEYFYSGDKGPRDPIITEHLQNYLRDGWTITDFKPLDGSAGPAEYSVGWIIVLLSRTPR